MDLRLTTQQLGVRPPSNEFVRSFKLFLPKGNAAVRRTVVTGDSSWKTDPTTKEKRGRGRERERR